ncbi:MAG: DUF1573 domain-containing protein [Chitinophagaceae bacterium]|nr:DUF1573 domain-containing protein [Chitinophagaceae bacterium]
MKKALLVLSLVLGIFSSISAQTAANIDQALKFKNDNFDFGKISFGQPATYTIEFTNISKDTLALVNARPGCGCTTPNFKPNEKIAPGKIGRVQITFNGSAMGSFTRATALEFSNGFVKQTQFAGEGVAITNAPAAPIINSPNKQ